MERYLFEGYDLSSEFRFPTSYLEIMAASELPDLDPWWFLATRKELSVYWADILRSQYPTRTLVPFAKRSGSDDIACFDGANRSANPKVYYVHAFASPGWEHRGEVEGFEQWLREARLESEEYKADLE